MTGVWDGGQQDVPLLKMPVPPMLEAAFGYGGQHRYLYFFQFAGRDRVTWADASCHGEIPWAAWSIYANAPAVRPYLERYPLTAPDDGLPGLALDRHRRRITLCNHHNDLLSECLPGNGQGMDTVSLQRLAAWLYRP